MRNRFGIAILLTLSFVFGGITFSISCTGKDVCAQGKCPAGECVVDKVSQDQNGNTILLLNCGGKSTSVSIPKSAGQGTKGEKGDKGEKGEKRAEN